MNRSVTIKINVYVRAESGHERGMKTFLRSRVRLNKSPFFFYYSHFWVQHHPRHWYYHPPPAGFEWENKCLQIHYFPNKLFNVYNGGLGY